MNHRIVSVGGDRQNEERYCKVLLCNRGISSKKP